jgi:hypothetical protein
MTLERFPLLFADLTSIFLFLPNPTGAVALSAAVFSLPWWSGGDRADTAEGGVFTEFAVTEVRTIEVVVAPFEDVNSEDGVTEDRIFEDGVSEGGVSEGGNTEDGVSEGGNTEGGVIEDDDIAEDRVSEQGITGDGATEKGITNDGATKDGVTEDGIAEDGDKDDGVAEVGIANGGFKLSEDGFWEGVAGKTGSNGRDNGKMSDVSSIICDRLGTQPLDNNDRPAPSVEGCW